MQPTHIPDDEVADAHRELAARGLPAGEFSFSAIHNIPGFGPIEMIVTVERKGRPPVRFKGGHGTSWVGDFAQSLKGGYFD